MKREPFAVAHARALAAARVPLERHRDPRVRALYRSLRTWLPIPIAAERTRNAAASLLLVDTLEPGARGEVTPRAAIGDALRNEVGLGGHVATDQAIEAAIRAWDRAARRGTQRG